MQHAFGAGVLYGLVNSGGVLVPRKFGALQDVSLDIAYTLKELYGQNQLPIAIARGQGKIQGKSKIAILQGGMLNDIFFGQSNATGQTVVVLGEAGSVPATPYQVTVANGATFKDDLGVTNATTGVPLTRVAAGPAQGQYSVTNAGVYTFAALDTLMSVLIDYSYTIMTGNTTTIINQYAGTTPQFIAELNTRFNGKQAVLRLNACVSSKLTLATKTEDFTIPEFDFSAFVDASGTLGTLSLAE